MVRPFPVIAAVSLKRNNYSVMGRINLWSTSRLNSDPDSQTNPDTPEALKKAGDEEFSRGAYASAVEKYVHAIEMYPDYLDAWNNLGFTLRKLGREEEARKCNEKVIQLKLRSQTEAGPEVPRQTPKHLRKDKNPVIAAVLSVIPGLGQIYCGQIVKGIIFLLLTIIGLILFIIPGLIIWVYAMYHAYKTSKRMNAGEIPWKETKAVSMIGFIAVILVGGIIIFTVFQAPIAIARADTLNRNGIQKLNTVQIGDGFSSLSQVESAKRDFIQAHDILSSVRDPSNPGQEDLQSMLLVTELLINASDVSASGVRAYSSQTQMASSINSMDWSSAGQENQRAKTEFEAMYTSVQQITTTLAALERTSGTSGSADIIREVKRNIGPLNTPDYIRLTEAYGHYIASREYNQQVGTYVSYEKGVMDKASMDHYMALSRDEELKALEIAESLMDSSVPKVAENAINLARVCKAGLYG